ncbi:MAG: GLUG motif-containing protein [Sedimentisphaerales bacterium]
MKTRTTFILSLTAILTLAASVFGAYSGGNGTAGNPYQISTKADLLTLAANTTDYGLCFILTADIDMGGQVFTTAIIAADTVMGDEFNGTAFTGTFDGNGHKITHFTINGGSYLGLFGFIYSGSSVKNLGLENFTVSGTSGSDYVGGLVGSNYHGSISSCYSTGTVGDSYCGVGGLVGVNNGSISNCYSTGVVSGYYYVGGLVGDYYGGSINNCYSTGNVTGRSYLGGLVGDNYDGNISNCYSTGIVTGSSSLGGLIGFKEGGNISSSYFLDVAGPNNGYGTPLTDAQMKQQSSFVGWDFLNIWNIGEGQTYPFFKGGAVIYNLTITATFGGTTHPIPGIHTYLSGSSVDVNAIPNVYYSFDHWELDGNYAGSANPYSVLMNGDHTLHAVFICANYELVPIIDTFTTVMESQTTNWDTGIGTPFVIYDAGLYKMWYEASSGPWPLRQVIAYAESNNGTSWFNKQVIHDSGSGYYATGSPWVIKEGGTYRMWHYDYYEWVAGDWSHYIAHMISANGINWPSFMSAGDQKVLSALGQSNPQGDGYCVFAPCVLYEPGIGYVMWYTVNDHQVQGGNAKIWRTTSSDGITWTNRQLSLPYINNTWEDGVGMASVVKENDGKYTMFYGAWDANSTQEAIGIAKSSDGITWTERRQFLRASDLGANVTFFGSSTRSAHFIDVDGKRYLYFNYYDKNDDKYKFGRIQIGFLPNIGSVNFVDYAVFASHWMEDCGEPNWCDETDFDHSGRVDMFDLAIFVGHWLEGI